jgi:hypothetical protein
MPRAGLVTFGSCRARALGLILRDEQNQLRRLRFPSEIIQQAIWRYFGFTPSFRDVEDLLAKRGIFVSYETVRRWLNHFGRRPTGRDGPKRNVIFVTWTKQGCRSHASLHQPMEVSTSRNARTFELDRRREFCSAQISTLGPSSVPHETSRPEASFVTEAPCANAARQKSSIWSSIGLGASGPSIIRRGCQKRTQADTSVMDEDRRELAIVDREFPVAHAFEK